MNSKWEYKRLLLPMIGVSDELNRIGNDRWELVSVDDRCAYFKRKVYEPPIWGDDSIFLDYP